MYIRPKTKRRLVILGGAFALICILIFGGYLVHARRARAELAKSRKAAMTAYAEGDYAAALPNFNVYLSNSKTVNRSPGEADTEALLAYAKSRAAIELPKSRHLFEAVNVLERYVRLKPDDAEARRMLLELYPRISYNLEAIELAHTILANEPLNADALRANCDALIAMARQDRKLYADALEVSKKLNDAAPLDVRGQLQTLWLMSQTRADDAKIVGRAEELRAKRPEDPRFELILASAYALTHQLDPARAALKRSADATPPDAPFVVQLVKQLDSSQMYDRSGQVLERAEGLLHDPDLSRLLARRMWQTGQYEAVAKRLENVDPAARSPDIELLALRALSLYSLERNGDADKIVNALGNRKDDSAAQAWAIALRARFTKPPLEPKAAATQFSSALDKDGDNAVIHFMLGEAYLRMGENDLAIESWKKSLMYAPSWAAPFSMIARTMIDTGDFEGARQLAQEAFRRSPGDVNRAADYVIAAYGAIGENATADELKNLLRVTTAVQTDSPGEARTFPIYVDLLARTGDRPAALTAVTNALKVSPPPAHTTVERLQIISKMRKLEIDEPLRAFLASTPAKKTPTSAIRSALATANTKGAVEGLNEIKASVAEGIAASGNDPAARLQWEVALLQYRDATGDDSAVNDWVTLADAHPKDLQVQMTVLQSRARSLDRALWQRTIDRVRDLTSDSGQLWQLERARLVLSGQPSDKDLNETLSRLTDLARATPDSPEPYRLLAMAHERSGEGAQPDERRAALNRAIDEMTKAADLRPEETGLQRELVRMLRAAGRADRAAERLDRLAMRGNALDPATQRWIADAYGDLGHSAKAIELLSKTTGVAAEDPALIAQLGSLYRRSGQFDEATKHYHQLLSLSKSDPSSLVEAAEFFASRKQPDEAEKFLAKLDSVATSANAQALRARFSERYGSPSDALAQYQAAAASDVGGAAAARELAGFHLRQRRYDDAIAAAVAGLTKHPQDPDLAAIRDRAGALKGLGLDPSIGALVNILSVQPRNAGAVEMLKLLSNARTAKPTAEQFVNDIRKAADAYPDSLPLQFSAVRGHLDRGQTDRAEQVARRTAGLFPDDPEAIRLLCGIYTARQDWTRLMEAAATWRKLSPDSPIAADVTLAQAMLETGDVTGATQRLEPYIAGISKQPSVDGQSAVLMNIYSQALIAAGRADDAAALLEPFAKGSPAWRETWLKLASAKHPTSAAASKWLAGVEPLIAKNVPEEQAALGSAWLAVGERFHDKAPYEKARQIGAALTSAVETSKSGEAWLLLAMASQSLGDLEAAEKAHRKVLELNASLPEAKNNLAYVLLLRGGADRIKEAESLASQAVSTNGNQAAFRDTLARIQANSGHIDAARSNFKKAIELDSRSLEARLGLAGLLARTGDRSEARALLEQVEREVKLGGVLSPLSEQELKAIWLTVREKRPQGSAPSVDAQ